MPIVKPIMECKLKTYLRLLTKLWEDVDLVLHLREWKKGIAFEIAGAERVKNFEITTIVARRIVARRTITVVAALNSLLIHCVTH